jgi:hypothetical protein
MNWKLWSKYLRRERKPLMLSWYAMGERYMYKGFKGHDNKGYSLEGANGGMYHYIGIIVVLSGQAEIHKAS